MPTPDTLRDTRIPLNNGSGAVPAVGFGTLISGAAATREATKTALEAGFRHFDCAECRAVGANDAVFWIYEPCDRRNVSRHEWMGNAADSILVIDGCIEVAALGVCAGDDL